MGSIFSRTGVLKSREPFPTMVRENLRMEKGQGGATVFSLKVDGTARSLGKQAPCKLEKTRKQGLFQSLQN